MDRSKGSGRNDKPEKLRKACDPCTLAKVKCSGERSGCSRCRVMGARCIYGESKVGKVAGVRAKKNRASSDLGKQGGGRGDLPPLNTSMLSESSTAIDQLQPTTRHFEDTLSGWSTDMPGPLTHNDVAIGEVPGLFDGLMDFPGTPCFSPGQQSYSMSNSIHNREIPSSRGGFDFDIAESRSSMTSISNDDGRQEASAPTQHAPRHGDKRHSPQLSFPRRLPPTSNLDSKCVLACCQIINTLEHYIEANVSPLDIILDVIKKAIDMLSHLINVQRDSRVPRCQNLFGVVMYQVIELLEAGCTNFINSGNPASAMASVLGLCGSGDLGHSSFAFGGFQLDEGRQHRWQARIVSQELQKVAEILQQVVMLVGVDHEPLEPGQEREPCYRDLERRLAYLREEVSKVEDP